MDQDVVSFVLRFVREAGAEQEARWRGIIKHVQSNKETHFTEFPAALAFMQGHIDEVIKTALGQPDPQTPGNPILETARLWGEMMPRYTQFMLDTMRESMETPFTPDAFNEQMERAMGAALAAWGLPGKESSTRARNDISALNEELATLRSRVATLEEALRKAQTNPAEDDGAADE